MTVSLGDSIFLLKTLKDEYQRKADAIGVLIAEIDKLRGAARVQERDFIGGKMDSDGRLVKGGDPDCDHNWVKFRDPSVMAGAVIEICGKCNAERK